MLLLAAFALFAQISPVDFTPSSDKKIAFQNSILAKVNGTTLSMMDVKKKMDLLFHQRYPHLSQSSAARCQFYEQSWRALLMEMIDNELVLADAADHDVKIPDAEVRETMESRFGPNVLATLDQIGLSYNEAWKILKNELIVQRMSWWFIQSKAIQSVTPQSIREAYQQFLEEHPPYLDLQYQVVTIQAQGLDQKLDQIADRVHQFLINSGKSLENVADALLEIDPSIQISTQYQATDLQISESYRSILASLLPGSYSAPVVQKSRGNKRIAKIFYLAHKTDHPASSFQELSASLRDQLIQNAMMKQSALYLERLRKSYGFDTAFLQDTLSENAHPFSLQ
ncbi:MAG TPA: hypothetical protein VLE95_06705 [Chlamydiales bacterium]|nr:hypothetical protein [Chlamydiales bacterium]